MVVAGFKIDATGPCKENWQAGVFNLLF